LTDNIIYDNKFDGNEWFAICMIVIGAAAIMFLPKRFTKTEALFNLMVGVVLGLMFDHTIAVPPLDLYDINDQSQYQLFDMISYLMYSPFGYLFIYFYYKLRFKGLYLLLYILIWTGFGICIEYLGVIVGVFHYKDNYKLYYSIPIYLMVQSLHLSLFHYIFIKKYRLKTASD
jgi:hypothetical protein